MISKVSQRIETDNDVYLLEVVGDRLLINDDYHGIKVLDTNLALIQTVHLPEDTAVYRAYTLNQPGLVALYCPDNSSILMLAVATGDVEVINCPHSEVLAHGFCWTSQGLLVATTSGGVAQLFQSELTSISQATIEEHHPQFSDFCRMLAEVDVLEATGDLSVVYETPDSVVCHSHHADADRVFPKCEVNAHQVTSGGSYLLYVAEDMLLLQWLSGGTECVTSDPSRYYLRARFLGGESQGSFVVLSAERANAQHCYLETYHICQD